MFKIILIFALIYIGLKLLVRIFAPMMMNSAMHKAKEHFEKQTQNNTQKPPKQDKKKVGEYVDFEEVD